MDGFETTLMLVAGFTGSFDVIHYKSCFDTVLVKQISLSTAMNHSLLPDKSLAVLVLDLQVDYGFPSNKITLVLSSDAQKFCKYAYNEFDLIFDCNFISRNKIINKYCDR